MKLVVGYLLEDHDSGVDESLITSVTDRKGHNRKYAMNLGIITRDFGLKPETQFAEGIVKTIQWYLENPEWLNNLHAKK